MTARTIIIEDERPAARRLGNMLNQLDSDIEILETLDSVEGSIAWLEQNPHPDLIFADIQLGDGLSFTVFEQIPVDSFLIFTTAYDEYAIRAFEHNSVDYILKPIEKQKLQQALDKFQKLRSKGNQHDMTAILQFIAEEKKEFKTHFWINVASQIQKIETKEIVFIHSLDKSTFIYTQNGRSRMVDYSLDQLERLLDPSQFFRISRQTIVHFSFISQIEMLSKSRLMVKTTVPSNEQLIVSSNRQTKFKQWLDR